MLVSCRFDKLETGEDGRDACVVLAVELSAQQSHLTSQAEG